VVWDNHFRGTALISGPALHRIRVYLRLYIQSGARFLLLLLFAAASIPSQCRDKNAFQYGEGLIVNIPLPEPEVAQVVEEAVQNTIIRGTKEYNKDEYVAGAVAAISTPAFPKWTEGGKVFYKVRNHALDPRNFKDGSDVGTLAVRYVVKPQGDKNTVLRLDAIFVEDFRRIAHPSNGSVESEEYKDIQERLASIELVKKETEEALRAKEQRSQKQKSAADTDVSSSRDSDKDDDDKDGAPAKNADSDRDNVNASNKEVLSTPPSTASDGKNGDGNSDGGLAPTSTWQLSTIPQSTHSYQENGETLEQHVAELRQQLEKLVKQPGAPLKSAPFHTASTLKSLSPGAEVLIRITTPYWYGVETHDGDHGWIQRDQLEQLP
jgi:hypothetical protein